MIELQPRHHTRAHVFNHDVRPLDQSICQLESFGIFQIKRDAMLRIIEKSKAARTIQADLTVFEWWILQAKTVRPLLRLDVNYARTKVRQVLADARAGCVGAELYDLHAGERILYFGTRLLRYCL